MKLNFILRAAVLTKAQIAVTHIMQKPMGLVLVGDVIKGSISKGDSVAVWQGKSPVFDEIIRIERFGKEILTAEKGLGIGICLKNTSKEQLLAYQGCLGK